MVSVAKENVLKKLDIHIDRTSGITDAEIESKRRWIADQLTGPLHQAAYAQSQDEYETAYDRIFASLDQLEETLGERRYFSGDEITEADVELYSFLVRFDIIYFYAFGLNRNKISDFDNIFRYAKRLYERPEFRNVTDFDEIKIKFYTEQDDVENPYHIIPQGPRLDKWKSDV